MQAEDLAHDNYKPHEAECRKRQNKHTMVSKQEELGSSEQRGTGLSHWFKRKREITQGDNSIEFNFEGLGRAELDSGNFLLRI